MDRVSKRYQLGKRSVNAREAITGRVKRALRRDTAERTELWSLRDVSFSVNEGEALGIVGPNGAGKSTILKILTGITVPTQGVVHTHGRVAALLEVGTGFHPELTGRENVYLNGAILGMGRRDIRRRFDEIVDFAGVAKFLDTPVKHYSSGMYLRLAFAVAANLEPDILVVDEILAVGDAEFQRKCLNRMREVEIEGRTVVFVSHDLDTLTSLCPRSLWLEAGVVRDAGPTLAVVRRYLAAHSAAHGGSTASITAGPVTVHRVRIVPVHAPIDAPIGAPLFREEPFAVDMEFSLAEVAIGLDVAVYLTNGQGTRVIDEAWSDRGPSRIPPGAHRLRLEVPPVLNVGEYTVGLWIGTSYHDILDLPSVATFRLEGSDHGRPGRVLVLGLPMTIQSLDG